MKKLHILFLMMSCTFSHAVFATDQFTNEEEKFRKLSKIQNNNNSNGTQYLPNEILLKIFDNEPNLLPSINRVNKEWHSWTSSKIAPYKNLYIAYLKQTTYDKKNTDEDMPFTSKRFS